MRWIPLSKFTDCENYFAVSIGFMLVMYARSFFPTVSIGWLRIASLTRTRVLFGTAFVLTSSPFPMSAVVTEFFMKSPRRGTHARAKR